MSEDLSARKRLRLKNYDYSQNGSYFITICVKGRHELLGTIYENNAEKAVTDVGAAALCGPPYLSPVASPAPNPTSYIELSEIGEMVNEYLKRTDIIYHLARLNNFVIMPNHLHLLITIDSVERGSGTQRAASPTIEHQATSVIPQIVHGLKSFTKKCIGESIWQRSYHDHIVRNLKEYNKISGYIDTNVQNWKNDIFNPKANINRRY